MKTAQSQRLPDYPYSRQGDGNPVVFFDGACSLYRREIAHYRGLRGADSLNWIDITQSRALMVNYDLDPEIAMARFHVLDASGHWQTGAWGFAELWSHLPGYRWFAKALRTLHLLPILDRGYTLFARWRLRHRCSDGACNSAG